MYRCNIYIALQVQSLTWVPVGLRASPALALCAITTVLSLIPLISSAQTDKLIVKDGTDNITFKVEDDGTLTTTKCLFGEEATSDRGPRIVNLVGEHAVMRIWRIHESYGTGFDLIHSSPADPDTKIGSWHVFAAPYSGDNIFAIMDRTPTDRVRLSITSSGYVGIGMGTTLASYPLEMASGAHVTTGGVWVNGSSRDYKENISTLSLDNAQDALSHLEPVIYNYKAERGEQYLGFIAEDVPELVAMGNRKSLSPMDIVAVLTKVVQEQQKTIAELSRKVNKM